MSEPKSAAIVTVGSELIEGLRVDTNTAEIARDLQRHGFRVAEALSVGDDAELLASALSRLTALHSLVVTTGGLGPDARRRDARGRGKGARRCELTKDPGLVKFLRPFVARHNEPGAAEQVLTQALVFSTAPQVLVPVTGTAAGQVVATPAGLLGPAARTARGDAADARRMALPDSQRTSRAARSSASPACRRPTCSSRPSVRSAAASGIGLTVLATPGDRAGSASRRGRG